MNNQIAIIFVSAAVFILWIFYFWFYWRYRVEKTRQELFAIRNELFDYAAEGNISFDKPAYWLLRETMNSFIRFTHRIDFVTVSCLLLFLKSEQLEEGRFAIFQKELETLPAEVKEKLEEYVKRMNKEVVLHLIKGSIPVMLFTIALVVYVLIRYGLNNIKNKVKKHFPGIDEIDKIAAELG